jgi:hypothetical protein
LLARFQQVLGAQKAADMVEAGGEFGVDGHGVSLKVKVKRF